MSQHIYAVNTTEEEQRIELVMREQVLRIPPGKPVDFFIEDDEIMDIPEGVNIEWMGNDQ